MVICVTALAQVPGTLDLSFDPGSSVRSDSSGWYSVQAMAVQNDDKVLVGGEFDSFNGTSAVGLVRLNVNGSVDQSFNTEYVNVTWCIAMQPDGKIIVAGRSSSYYNHIARLHANGELDTTFDAGLGVSGEGYGIGIGTVTLQSDGKILIGGKFDTVDGTARKGIARLNSDGSVDQSFQPGAGIHWNFNPMESLVHAVAVQTDGKIVIGGWFDSYNGTPMSGIARLNSDGSLDETFDPGSGTTDVFQIAIQTDGKIVIGGAFQSYDGIDRFGLARLNTDGSLDMTFELDENVAVLHPYHRSVSLQSDGKIICLGQTTHVFGTSGTNIVRLNQDGTLDTSFDAGWITGGVFPILLSCVNQSDGKILIGGHFDAFNGIPTNCIARLNAEPTGGGMPVDEISLYPNPASSSISVHGLNHIHPSRFTISTTIGEVVKTGVISAGNKSVDVSSLMSGLYMLNINGVVKRLVVQ